MGCPSCGQNNPEGSKFCLGCGSQLALSCADCGAKFTAGSRFCNLCGAAVASQAASPGASPAGPYPTAQATMPARHPTSFAGGRYEIRRFLGEGGKKRVYLSYDRVLDREVALAVIKSEGLDDSSRARISREAQAMGRLGESPNILAIHDLGEEDGQPYMILPLMQGGDVEGLIGNAPDHRIPLEEAIALAKQVCRGLEFAHNMGVIHRDLKPANIWLTADGTAKIGDFGLAVSLDRSRLTTEGMMVGTVAYMPPEQALGGEITPNADLYSLGAMLYELVTGRPPFLGDDSVAIIGQHINTPPVATVWHNGECPRPLDALILRLLAKDPAERPGSAADVLAALEAIDLSVKEASVDSGVGASGLGGPDEVHALDSLAAGVFVGRHREMSELKAALEDALSGRGRLVTLVGEPGIGKTRTAQELATYAGLRGAQVLWGRCYEEQGMPPYWPWVQAIRSYVRRQDPERLRAEMGAGASDIAQVVSDVREQLPGLEPAPDLEPEQARFRLFDAIAVFLKAASLNQPLVLILDDLHWADKPSLSLLQFVARELHGARLVLVCAYRDMELSRQHPLAETLADLTRETSGGGFQRVLLRGLSQEDVSRFIALVAGLAPPSGLAEAVYAQTEGNPLFVTEVVRLLVQEGEIGHVHESERPHTHGLAGTGVGPAADSVSHQVVGRDSWTVRIPEGVREVVGRRLNRLSQRCNETLTVASVIGREFGLDQLTRLIDDQPEDRILEVLEEALAARVIEEIPRVVGRYQFTHALIKDTLDQELSTTRRVRLQARIAEALEDLYGDDSDAHAHELAHHFAEAESLLGTEKLVRYSLLAGERALAAFAWEEALVHLIRGLEARGGGTTQFPEAEDGESARLHFALAQAIAGTGYAPRVDGDASGFDECLRSLAKAFGFFAKTGDVDRAVAVARFPVPTLPGQRTGSRDLIEAALKLVPGNSHNAGLLFSRLARVMALEENDDSASQEASNKALAIAKSTGDVALEMHTLVNAGETDLNYLRFPEGLRKVRAAIELATQANDLYWEVWARYFEALALWCTGALDDARSSFAIGLASAETLRDRFILRACEQIDLQGLV